MARPPFTLLKSQQVCGLLWDLTIFNTSKKTFLYLSTAPQGRIGSSCILNLGPWCSLGSASRPGHLTCGEGVLGNPLERRLGGSNSRFGVSKIHDGATRLQNISCPCRELNSLVVHPVFLPTELLSQHIITPGNYLNSKWQYYFMNACTLKNG